MSGPVILWASSGYGANTRQPFVTIHWKDVVVQCSPDEARQFASAIIQAAEAAEQDGFMVEFTKESVGFDDAAAAAFLDQYRQWREKRCKSTDTTEQTS